MKTPITTAILSVCLALVAIPAFGQKLYPAQGPLTSQTPPVIYSGHLKRPVFGSGPEVKVLKSWSLPNGEVLEGNCSEVTASSANTKTPGSPESYPPQPNLSFAWDAVYGSGYFAAHILGGKVWQGVFKGNDGTILQVEMQEQLGRERINNERYKGAAIDNKGNVYKLVW